MDTTVYMPQNIEDTKYPGEKEAKDFSTKQHISNGIYKPVTIEDNPFPYKKVANEIYGSNINTYAGHYYRQITINE